MGGAAADHEREPRPHWPPTLLLNTRHSHNTQTKPTHPDATRAPGTQQDRTSAPWPHTNAEGGKVLQRKRCSTLTPVPGQARRRDGRPLPPPPVLQSGQPPSCCPRAVTGGQPRPPTGINGHQRKDNTAGQRTSPAAVARFPSSQPNAGASGGPRSGMALLMTGTGIVVGHQGAGIPSRRRRRRSGLRGWGQDRSTVGCSILPPTPQPATRQARRRDGIPAPRPRPAASQHRRVPLACH